jgi:3-methyladenine DNA glycosylase AlkD
VVDLVDTILAHHHYRLTVPAETTAPGLLVRLVRRRIAERADPAKAPQMRAYMKSALPYRGVTSVPLRGLLTEVYDAHPLADRGDWEAAVRELWDDAAYREERYAAMALASDPRYLAHQDPDALELYRHLVVTGAWWDYVDPLASRNVGRILASHRDVVTSLMLTWSAADDLWLRRTAILCQLQHKDGTDLELLSQVVTTNLEGSRYGSEFFVRKAIGWALRQHARTDPDWVRTFVAEHDAGLSLLSRREALKHL